MRFELRDPRAQQLVFGDLAVPEALLIQLDQLLRALEALVFALQFENSDEPLDERIGSLGAQRAEIIRNGSVGRLERRARHILARADFAAQQDRLPKPGADVIHLS